MAIVTNRGTSQMWTTSNYGKMNTKCNYTHVNNINMTDTIPHATMISLSFTLECLIICALCMLTSCNACMHHDISTNRKIHVFYKIELSSATIKLRCSILLAPQNIIF